jgi:topoisomerase-4 subunit A
VTFGGGDSFREPLVLDVEEYIGLKSYKAKGKRITTFQVERIEELEPTRFPEPPAPDEGSDEEPDEEPVIEDPDHGKSQSDLIDEMTGQMKLFD